MFSYAGMVTGWVEYLFFSHTHCLCSTWLDSHNDFITITTIRLLLEGVSPKGSVDYAHVFSR